MLLRQLEYFCAVARTGSFTRAAEECYVSQSAISQQIKALEHDLGCDLIARHGRTFSLTPAGAHLARRATTLIDDAARLRREVVDLAEGAPRALRLGYLNRYDGWEVQGAVAAFARRHPSVEVIVSGDSHEGLYERLASGDLDLVFNDRRRALSEAYENVHLVRSWGYVEVSEGSSLATLESVTVRQLAGETCILVVTPEQMEAERSYYVERLNFTCSFARADTLEQARFMVAGNKGFLPTGTRNEQEPTGSVIRRIPVVAPDGEGGMVHDHSDYYAFWPRAREHPFAREFATILVELFS